MILRCDYDQRSAPSVGRLVALLYRAGYRLVWLEQRRSPGGRGWHVELCVSPRPRSCLEVVALQAVLGSDPRREAYNICRAKLVDSQAVSPYWRRRWNVLYDRRLLS